MRTPIAALLVVTSFGCPKRDDMQATSSAEPGAASIAANAPIDASPSATERQTERDSLVALLREEGISEGRVLAAMRRVPRHVFVPESHSRRAYVNEALPIGHGQTISQPIVVAAMTEAADPDASDKCLEIGTGSGYQAAILAELCKEVYSIEYLAPLAELAKSNLRRGGYEGRVELRTGDGYRGWPEAAPFDVVLVTAAPPSVPRPLLDQLAPNGRLVVPVGPRNEAQRLELITRAPEADGGFTRKTLMPVRFVPFVGEAEHQRQ